MTGIIVESKQSVSLLGGGLASRAVVETLRAHSETLVAADGGARHACAIDWIPDAVIGDLDSLDPRTRRRIPKDRIYCVADQDSTDFEKCLSRISAPLILGAGFLGARVDHQLACLHALMVHCAKPIILLDDDQIIFLCPPRIEMPITKGSTVSVFPLVPVAATSVGLTWPLKGLDLAPGRTIGTSNIASDENIELTCDRPGLLVILPRPAFDHAVVSLDQTAARWTAL